MRHFYLIPMILCPLAASGATFVMNIDPAENNSAAVAELRSAFLQARESPETDEILLFSGGRYEFSDVAESGEVGANALPIVDSDGAEVLNEISLVGEQSHLARSESAAAFRFLEIGPNGRLTLSDITLSGGLADGPEGSYAGAGGAILSSGYLSLNNCKFSENQASHVGGAIYQSDGNARLLVNECRFEGNVTKMHGGAIDSIGAFTQISSSSFIRNEATVEGGSLAYANGEMIITNSRFEENRANLGGAIRTMGPLSVEGCEFLSNTSTLKGGAIFLRWSLANASIQNSRFILNESEQDWGGAVDIEGGNLDIESCEFEENHSGISGGAISNGGITSISACRFLGNIAMLNGGAVNNGKTMQISDSQFLENKAQQHGGAVSSDLSERNRHGVTSIKNSNFSGNVSDSDEDGVGDGGAMAQVQLGALILANNTIYDNIDMGGESNDVFGPYSSYENSMITSIEGSEGLDRDFSPEDIQQ